MTDKRRNRDHYECQDRDSPCARGVADLLSYRPESQSDLVVLYMKVISADSQILTIQLQAAILQAVLHCAASLSAG